MFFEVQKNVIELYNMFVDFIPEWKYGGMRCIGQHEDYFGQSRCDFQYHFKVYHEVYNVLLKDGKITLKTAVVSH